MILGINGSPRKANTELMLDEALAAAAGKTGAATEKINLRRLTINPCLGCFKCTTPGGEDEDAGCRVFRDDMDLLLPKLAACTGLIIASPVYFGGVTAQLKAFMDRTEPLLRYGVGRWKLGLRNKIGAAIAVGGNRNGGQEATINAIHHFFFIQDLLVVGTGPDPDPGCYLGAAAHTGLDPETGSLPRNAVTGDPLGLRAAGIIGRRVAEAAAMITPDRG